MLPRAEWTDEGGLVINYWPQDEHEAKAVEKLYAALGGPGYFMLMSAVFEVQGQEKKAVRITLGVPRPTERN